jgi:Zn-dependent peptidase ImmA (M78 family)
MEPVSKTDFIFGSLQSALFFLDNDLSIEWSGANGTHIAPRGFIEIRFVLLIAIRTSDQKRFIIFHEFTC